MNKWIVVTTINPPQPAIETIAKLKSIGFNCVVVGDKKSPANWQYDGIDYLSVDAQKDLYPGIADELPYNHYCRKNIGYLYAIKKGADLILETDDDNIPLDHFGKDIDIKLSGRLVGDSEWVNVYKYFTDRLIWPRGNPLDAIHECGKVIEDSFIENSPIQQFLANGDPDVDAIYRLIEKQELDFDDVRPVFLDKGSWCSFNSQNTLFFKDYFAALYLPCHVSFRMTDIWRSFVAQNILWSDNKRLSFRAATVRQIRNQHDLMKDFKDEVDGYLGNRNICRLLKQESEKWTADMTVSEKVFASWSALHQGGFIQDRELKIVSAWLNELSLS